MLKRVYVAKKLPKVLDADITKYYAKEFYKGVITGFKEDILKIDWTTPDLLVIRHLEANVYEFAAAKNYQQLKDITKALVDKEGKLRSFGEFKNEAAKVVHVQNTKYMRTEYNLAVAGGQMSASWHRIQQSKKVLPYLKYLTVGDDRVRPEHAELDGVIRLVDDVFWDTYYPPNGWNCRCDVLQLADAKETPADEIIYPEKMPELFQINLAKNGLVFPPGHPYYDGIPDDLKEQALALMSKHHG